MVNCYRDGNDSVSWHKDDESFFGKDLVIATISLGGTRKFKVKHNGTGEVKDFQLVNGDLIVLAGQGTSTWNHTIPKTAKPVEQRISLAYRTINEH